jgi:glycosyltransferase involved in cell wall biosynthesis
MRRVLMIAPHFPPDTGAATHRVRLLAPHLAEFGWQPTVLTVDPSVNESRLDPDLAAMVPSELEVVRASAWSPRWTRKLGIGDLGLRAFTGLYREAKRILASKKYDALFITIFPTYPALLGPLLKREFGIPFVLDYIDPWVSAWGKEVGGGKNGSVDMKSRLTRSAALRLEPLAVRSADAITAVSAATYEMIQDRIPEARGLTTAAIPYGGDAADFSRLRSHPRKNQWYDKNDGDFHIVYMGTLLPLGFETLRAVLRALASIRTSAPETHSRIRLHFFGTSNQTVGEPEPRVTPIAQENGVAERVSEYRRRVDYLDALQLQVDASAILLMGSSEPHYTASKLYPALLSGRPIIAVYHSASTVAEIMSEVTSPPNAFLVTYSDSDPVTTKAPAIADALQNLAEHPATHEVTWPEDRLDMFSARSLAHELAKVFDTVSSSKRS